MNRSRKKRSRGEIRRRRQLREESERTRSYLDEDRTENEIPQRSRIKKYKIELLLAAFAIIGVVFIMFLGPDRRAAKELRDSFNFFLYSRSWEWDESFSQGYKIIVLTEKDIIQTSMDTLPDSLKVNWKEMNVARIKSSQMSGTIEKIKITLNDIAYAPVNISGVSATVTLSLQKGASARLVNLGELEFVAKIVEIRNSELFFLLGLRKL